MRCIRLCIGILALALAAGCSPSLMDQFADSFGDVVTVPTTDLTPPTVSFTIPDITRGGPDLELRPGSPPLAADVPASSSGFFVVATTQDPEGVARVAVRGHAILRCTSSSSIGQIRQAEIDLRSIDDSPPGETALTRRWIPFYVSREFMRCSESATFHPITMQFELWGEGANFGDVVVQTGPATFTFSF